MANAYGWLYAGATVSEAAGSVGSIQVRGVNGQTLTGDSNLTWDGSTLYANGAVNIVGQATVNGFPFSYGNPTIIPADSTFTIPENGRVILMSDSDCTITVVGTLDVKDNAIAKIKDFETI